MQQLPQSTQIMFLQPDATYQIVSSGVAGELQVSVPITDGVCLDDCDPSGNETTSDAQALAQDVYHIIIEVLGSNLDDPNRGIGAQGYCSGPLEKLEAMPATIDSQLRKDSRIDSSHTTLTKQGTGEETVYFVNCTIVANGAVIPVGMAYTPATGALVPVPVT